MFYFTLLLFLATGVFGFWYWSKQHARTKLMATELSEHQRAIVANYVPRFRKLPPELRAKLEGKINLFRHQIEFVGCNGLDVTEEMQLSVAAQACLLVANTDAWYEQLRTVLIYPDAFKSQEKEYDGCTVMEREIVRTGESWPHGPVVLSWADIEHTASDDRDGHNIVLHEFAHQIDDLFGHSDGASTLNHRRSLSVWERVFTNAYERHVRNINDGKKTVLDDCGADVPEEFFAVAVEVFFEKSEDLKCEESKFYEQLSELFRLDPLTWR